MRITYVGGPTALIEWQGARLLTDPTFDPAGTSYELPAYTLRKTQAPAVDLDTLGRLDAVLLSHDHHFDNLDRAGRASLDRAACVLTTVDGASRLSGNAIGLAPWQTFALETPSSSGLLVTATPARHGPPQGDRGPVIGFVLERSGANETVYVSGDTVWFVGVDEVAAQFDVSVAVLFVGAAKVRAAGDSPLTFTADEAVTVARRMPRATIVPLHYEGWEHFSQSRADVERAFHEAGLKDRLLWATPGKGVEVGQA